MIITIPLKDEPFHDDPEWNNWQAIWNWIAENGDLDYFLHQLIVEPELRNRFSRFVAAAQQFEHKIKNELEHIAETCDILNPPRVPIFLTPEVGKFYLFLEIHPAKYPNFNRTFGNWEEFKFTLIEKYPSLEAFSQRLQSSLEFRQDILQFLQEATHFEEAVCQQFQTSSSRL